MTIYFCENCGQRVLEADIESGTARAIDETHAHCPNCRANRHNRSARNIGAMRSTGRLPRMSSGKAVPGRRPTAALPTNVNDLSGQGHEPAKSANRQRTLLFVGAAVIVVCVAGAVLLISNESTPPVTTRKKTRKKTAPSPTLPPSHPPSQTVSNSQPTTATQASVKTEEYDPRAWTANSILAAAKKYSKEHPDDAWGYRDKLKALTDGYRGTPAAEEARMILEKLVIPRDENLADDTAWAGAVDLFKIISPKRDALEGKCRFQNGVLKTDRSRRGWFRANVPYAPPKEYDVKLRFKRLQGNECIVVGLANQNRPFCFMAAGWKNTKAGFENIKNVRIPHNPRALTRASVLTTGVEYELIVQVRGNVLRAYLNGRHLVSADASPDDLSRSPSWAFPYTGDRGLGLGHYGPYEFYEMRLRPVTGKGKAIDRSGGATAQ